MLNSDNNQYDAKDFPVLAVIKIATTKGTTEIILRDNTNVHESVDRLIT